MKNRAHILGDYGKSAPVNWIEPFKSIGMAGVLIIASDQVDDADAATINELSEASEMGIIAVGIQKGTAITNETGNKVEHFGFRDGVSQPLIKGIDDARAKGNDEFFEPSDFVLAGPDYGWANEGSFLVYRRLRQDVNGFWNFVRKTSKAINLSPEQLASKFVGRWDSGAPLAKYPDNDPNSLESADDNDFEYMIDSHGHPDDPRGFKTPRFSHIRKVYPRDDGLSTPKKNSEENDRHRILRRGIPYGKQMSKIDNMDRGLLFMCYQKNLSRQFEFIQAKFANSPRFPKPEHGVQHGHDPIVGRPMKEHDTGFVNLVSEKKTQVIRGLKQWVVTTGGEYFFSPSLSALKNL
jgi:Dyp-type peroxidase family